MNIDHFGIVITLIILAAFLSVALLTQANISILPESFNAPHSDAFADYCKQLNIKC